MEDMVEIEEWYKGGQVVRRYINGIEVAPDSQPTAIQFCESVTTRKVMTKTDFEHMFGFPVPTK